MAITRFEQDPEGPPGMGLFHADDGSSLYAHDPEMAQRVSGGPLAELSPEIQAAASGDDGRTALAGFKTTEERLAEEAAGGQQAPAPPPVASDVQASMAPAAAPPPQQPQMTPEQAQAIGLTTDIAKTINDPVFEKGTKGGVVPTGVTETREVAGLPYDPNGPQVQERAAAHMGVQRAHANAAEAQAARSAAEANAYKAALPRLQEQAADAERIVEHRRRVYQGERRALDAMIAESENDSRSFNANKWFDDRGAIGYIGAGIAQAFGAYAATLRGGPNLVAQQINEYIDRDVANQRAQIEAGKVGINNQLAKLQRHYGDLDQAEAALKIAMQKTVDNQIASYAASTKSQEVQEAAQMWLADNQQRYILNEHAFENASYGKTSAQTTAKVIAPRAGGWREKTLDEKVKTAGLLEKAQNVAEKTYDTEIKRQKSLGNDPDKKDKTNELLIENLNGTQLLASRPEEATKIRDAKRLHSGAVNDFKEILNVAKESASGGRVGEAKGRIKVRMKRALEKVNTAAGQGVFRTDDDNYYTDALFDATGKVRDEVIGELIRMADFEYQSMVDAQRGSSVNVNETGGGKQVKYTGQASKNPTAKGQFKQVGR